MATSSRIAMAEWRRLGVPEVGTVPARSCFRKTVSELMLQVAFYDTMSA